MRHGTLPMVINMSAITFGHRVHETWSCAGCFLTLKVYAVSVSTLSTRAARIMREDMDTIGRNSRHKKT